MNRFIWPLACCTLGSSLCLAGPVDSLKAALARQTTDTGRVSILCQLSYATYQVDGREALRYADAALDLARKGRYPESMANAYLQIGVSHYAMGDFNEAIVTLDSAADYCRLAGDQVRYNKALVNKATVYNRQGSYPQALALYLQCLKVFEAQNDRGDQGNCWLNIGTIYYLTKDDSQALDGYEKAYALFSLTGNRNYMAVSKDAEGDVFADLKQYDKGEEAYHTALAYYDANGMVAREGTAWQALGNMHFNQGKFRDALADFQKSLSFCKSAEDVYQYVIDENNIADLYLRAYRDTGAIRGQFPQSSQDRASYLRLAEGLLLEARDTNVAEQNFELLQDNWSNLSDLYHLQGLDAKALYAYKQHEVYKDSVLNGHTQQTIQKLNDQRQIDLRDQQLAINRIEIADQRRQRYFYVAGLVLLGLVGGLLWYQGRQRRRNNDRLRALNVQLDEANRLKARFLGILSHDLRGPIAGLANFLYLMKEAPDLVDPRLAAARERKTEESVRHLLSTLEDLLLWSKGQMSEFRPEFREYSASDLFRELRLLYPSHHSSSGALAIDFEDPEGVKFHTDPQYLGTIARNLTGNAIKAVATSGPSGRVGWKAWTAGGKPFLSISDNGPGLPESGKRILFSETDNVDTRGGLGLHLVRDFAAAIGCGITVETGAEKGTTFTLALRAHPSSQC